MNWKRTKRIILNSILDKKQRFLYLAKLGVYNNMPDEEYIKKKFKYMLEYDLNLENPKTFNEKLQWLKLYDHNKKYTLMADKYEAKKIAASVMGEKAVIPTLGIWDSFEQINFEQLPEQFVLKCTHGSGGVIFVKDKNQLDKTKIKKELGASLKRKYFFHNREWPYKNIKPRIIAEKYMCDEFQKSETLVVYKIMCFNGKAKLIQVIQNDKTSKESIDYFDTEWNLLTLRQNFPNSIEHIQKPERLKEMLEIAERFSRDSSFLRIDLYLINGNIYFSEFTFYSDGGMAEFEPREWDEVLGSWIELPMD